ncbi:MAG: DUF3450 family protein [Planctomycetes bacterium]|nr:DUF3450 family protein [Planctomycetota bacterium]
MQTQRRQDGARRRNGAVALGALGLACVLTAGATRPQDVLGSRTPALEETRLKLGKWIETQQLVSKERKDWQQGKEVLLGRLELVKQEVATLEDKIREAQTKVEEHHLKHGLALDEVDHLKSIANELGVRVAALEEAARRLLASAPEPVQVRLLPLAQRMPDESTKAKVSIAERYQNVIGILNELNKANNELTVSYEIRNLSDGKPAEVRVIYVGLAQAYYVSAGGEAGIGRPSAEGWHWEPSKTIADDVLVALEILQNKHTPAFVPLPARIQ